MTGIIIGKYRGRYLTAKGQQSILLAAPTRSGKGVGVVIPNLLNYPDSVVVFDLKLENFRFTSAYRARHGQKVFLFAPFSETGETHRWNMLDNISRDPVFRVGDTLAVGQIFYPSDCDPREKFWNDNARNLFLAFVLYLLESPELPCTLGEVFRQSSGKGKPLKDHIQSIIAARRAAGTGLSDDCLDAFSRFLSSPENTLGNIISTFNAPLLVFANPIVDAATSASDFDIRTLRKERTSIYIGIQPNRLNDAALLVNMLFSQIIDFNVRELPENNPELRYQCLLVLDEFTSLGKVGVIAKANAYTSGYNIRLLTIIQSVAQLESVYGQADTRTLVTNHAVQILYPPREQKDANEYSEMLGYFTQKAISTGESRPRTLGQNGSSSENISDQRRALMLPQELKEMPQDEQIISMQNTKPIRCNKARYYEDRRFIDRLRSCTASLGAPMEKLSLPRRFATTLGFGRWAAPMPSEAALKYAAYVLKDLSIQVPTLDVELHRAKAESRIRPLQHKEQVDLSRLAIDVDQIPPLDDQEHPSVGSVNAMLTGFFAQLDWHDQPHGANDDGPSPSGNSLDQGWSETDETTQSAAIGARQPAVVSNNGPIDLSALDT